MAEPQDVAKTGKMPSLVKGAIVQLFVAIGIGLMVLMIEVFSRGANIRENEFYSRAGCFLALVFLLVCGFMLLRGKGWPRYVFLILTVICDVVVLPVCLYTYGAAGLPFFLDFDLRRLIVLVYMLPVFLLLYLLTSSCIILFLKPAREFFETGFLGSEVLGDPPAGDFLKPMSPTSQMISDAEDRLKNAMNKGTDKSKAVLDRMNQTEVPPVIMAIAFILLFVAFIGFIYSQAFPTP